jgi:hypothetical protein
MRVLKNTIFFNVISLICTVSIGILIIGCINNSEYKAVTVTKSGIRFSFEYPKSYSDYTYSLNSENTMVVLFRYLPDTNPQTADREILIDTWITNTAFPNATALLDRFLDDIPDVSKGFKLIERSPIQVSGITGEMIYYSERINNVNLNTDNIKSWEIYLDYKEKIVTISLICNIDNADKAKEEFDYLIQSFNFMN